MSVTSDNVLRHNTIDRHMYTLIVPILMEKLLQPIRTMMRLRSTASP